MTMERGAAGRGCIASFAMRVKLLLACMPARCLASSSSAAAVLPSLFVTSLFAPRTSSRNTTAGSWTAMAMCSAALPVCVCVSILARARSRSPMMPRCRVAVATCSGDTRSAAPSGLFTSARSWAGVLHEESSCWTLAQLQLLIAWYSSMDGGRAPAPYDATNKSKKKIVRE